MKPWLALLFVCSVLAGCSGEDVGSAGGGASLPRAVEIQEPKFDSKDPLVLLGSQNSKVRLGMSRLETLKAFPKPEAASLISDIPFPLRGQTTITAESWQQDPEGFGMILYGDRVCLVQHQVENMTEDEMTNQAKLYRAADGEPRPPIDGRFVRYRFWQTETERLMLCAFLSASDGTWRVTTALGATKVMDALGMSEEKANEDTFSADTTLQAFFQKQNKPLPAKPSASPSPEESPAPTASASPKVVPGV